MYYADYLQLHTLLSAQQPVSAAHGRPAHDEMLFIIVHQAYELWFKQILHELDRIQAEFAQVPLEDEALGRIVHGLDRIEEILQLLVRQLDVLETITPLDFLDFRDLLAPASGFQSAQFRAIEIRLGLPRERRLRFDSGSFEARLNAGDQARVAAAERQPSLLAQLDAWLARMPFVRERDFDFSREYRKAVRRMLEADAARVRTNTVLSDEQRRREADALDQALSEFEAIFSPAAAGTRWRMSLPAIQAALFITVYRDHPVLQQPFRLLAAIMDMEETLTTWRYRHALMVQRMIGVKIGTGGSSGHDYLRATAEQHRVFEDLFRLSTYLIPRSQLPRLPAEIVAEMGYVYARKPAAR